MALRLKDGRRPSVAEMMARLVGDVLPDALVAAVPLHHWQLWRRRFYQALLLTRGVAFRAGRECVPDLLFRTKATPKLPKLGRRARTVLLVYDVFTSGATAEACARTLKLA